MKGNKVSKFLQLAGEKLAASPAEANDELRALGAQLLLSETLEYVIKGLGVEVKVGDTLITDPNGLDYSVNGKAVDDKEMLDGLADVAYTMYWNKYAFNQKLEEAHELVCDNNLEKFVKIDNWSDDERELESTEWDLGQSVSWPDEVTSVRVVKVDNEFYGVGKDKTGKVRKPSTYRSVDLGALL